MMPELDPEWEYYTPDEEIEDVMTLPSYKVKHEPLGVFGAFNGFSIINVGRVLEHRDNSIRDKFCRMWNDGYTVSRLCETFDICHLTVIQWRNKYGLQPRTKKVWTDERKALLIKCHNEGVSVENAAKLLGINEHVYRTMRVKLGIRVGNSKKEKTSAPK